MEQKVLVCDVDGTLAESRQPICEEIKSELFRIAKEKEVCLITGGSLELVKYQIGKVPSGVRIHIMPTMGTQYYIIKGSKLTEIYREELTEEDKTLINGAFWYLAEEFWLDRYAELKDQLDDRGSQITFSALGKDADLKKKKEFDPKKKRRNCWKQYLETILPNYEIKVGGTTSIDITRKGGDKSFGLTMLGEHLNMNPRENFYYIGDKIYEGGNDDAAIKMNLHYLCVQNPEQTLKVLKQI